VGGAFVEGEVGGGAGVMVLFLGEGGEVYRLRVRWRLRYILTIFLTRIEYKFDSRRTTSNHEERAVIAFFGIPCKSVILAVDYIAKQHP